MHPEIPADGVLTLTLPGGICALLNAQARDAQLELHWPDRQPNSLLALAAAEWTRTSHPRSFTRVVEGLFSAYFACGQDIGAQNIIDGYVGAAGVQLDALHAALADGSAVAAVASARRQAMAAGVMLTPVWLAARWRIIGLHPVKSSRYEFPDRDADRPVSSAAPRGCRAEISRVRSCCPVRLPGVTEQGCKLAGCRLSCGHRGEVVHHVDVAHGRRRQPAAGVGPRRAIPGAVSTAPRVCRGRLWWVSRSPSGTRHHRS